MLSGFPAGLVIYWAWNSTISIVQQLIIMGQHGIKPASVLANLRRKPG